MNHATLSLRISCALVALALGCGKDNPVEPIIQPGPPRYHTPSAPESTVLNYGLAWDRRDSTMIDSMLTDDYVGTSVDMADPSPSTLTFTRSDETRALGGIQLDPLIGSVSIIFPPPSLWEHASFPGDPIDWVTITMLQHARIYVSRTDASDYTSTGSRLEFKVKPVTSAAGTTWKIIRWSEIHQAL